MKYYVAYERADDGLWGAYPPDLLGVGVGGYATREEARESIRIAIDMHLEAMRRDGDPIPEPNGAYGEFIEVV